MISTLFTIWLLHCAALLSPGANMLLVSQMAAGDQGRSARIAALGVAVGTLIWSSCAVLGVHAMFLAFPALRLGVQVAGGIYLMYLAFRLWGAPSVSVGAARTSLQPMAAFRLGLLTNLINPKVALFFGSIFAASFPASPGPLLPLLAVVMVVVNTFCWHTFLAFVFSRQQVQMAYATTRGGFNRVAASAMGAIGLALVTSAVREARR